MLLLSTYYTDKHAEEAKKGKEVYARVLQDYIPPEGQAEYLTLKYDDVVQVLDDSLADWWFGSLNGRVGKFPAAFVVPVPKPVYCFVVYDYIPDQGSVGLLELHADEFVYVYDRSDVDWWRGEINGRRGLFPSAYVTEVEAADRAAGVLPRANIVFCTVVHEYVPGADLIEKASVLQLSVGDVVKVTDSSHSDWWLGECKGATGAFPSSHVEVADFSHQHTHVHCVSSFTAQKEGELSLHVGDVIEVTEEPDGQKVEGWYLGKLDGKTGKFPVSHVVPMPIPKEAAKVKALRRSASRRASRRPSNRNGEGLVVDMRSCFILI